MDSKTKLHGSVLGKDDFVAPRDNMGVNGPAGSVESKTGTDRPEVRYQADHGAYQSETRSASHRRSAQAGAPGAPPPNPAPPPAAPPPKSGPWGPRPSAVRRRL